MPHTVEYTNVARKDIKGLDRKAAASIIDALDAHAEDLTQGDVKTLQGHSGLFRLRVGSYRAVYRIEADNTVVLVVVAAHRKEVYDKLKRRV